MNVVNKILLSLLTLAICYSATSQNIHIGTSQIENFYRADYQAGSQNWDIQQNANGKIYFANNLGLLEYDGHFWNTYTLPNASVVRSINIHENGFIYAGGFNELGYFKPEKSNNYQFQSLKDFLPSGSNNFDEVWKIFTHPDGIIFQSFNQLMIYKDSMFIVIPAPSRFHFSFFINNEYYVNDMEKGLMRYAMGKLFPLNGMEKLIGVEIWGILEHNNQLYISTASEGIFIYDGNTLQSWNVCFNDFLKKNQIYCSFETSSGNFAFGTIQNGLLICSPQGEPIQHLSSLDGLQNNTILCINEDYQNNLWVGTDHGIDYIEINSPLKHISYNYGISTGYAALMDKGILYLGTNQGLFYNNHETKSLYDFENKKLKIIENTGGQVWSLNKVGESVFCGHKNGTYIIDNKQAHKISDIPGGWIHLQAPTNENKVIGGVYSGLVLYEKINGLWQFKKQYEEFSESARSMEFDDDGTLWMTHGYKGIYHFSFSDDYEKIEKIDFYNSKNSQLSNQIFSLAKVDNEIAFLTGKGVMNFSKVNDNFVVNDFFKEAFGSDIIHSIKTDEDKNIWYFTTENAGVLRKGEDGKYNNVNIPFKQLKGQFVNSFEFVYPYGKNVLFATENGFKYYNTEQTKNYNYTFYSYINEIRTFNPDTILNVSDSTFQLSYANNHIEFTFSSNEFTSSSQTLYSTYLEGYESKWSNWHSRNTKEYTNLYEGDYRFKIKAKNIFGEISSIENVNFSVSPPFHRSIIALILYVIGFILTIIIIAISLKKRLDRAKIKDQQKQQELYKKRENELQQEALESEKEIIRMRNDQLRLGIKQKDKELANSTLVTIHKNEILINLKDHLKILTSSMTSEDNKHQVRKMIRQVNREINNDKQWEVFETHFESVHEEFLKRIKSTFPDLTPRELKLCAYLRMNISSKEISLLMNISIRGVEISRYRLRKKLQLERKTNLTDFILSF